MSASTSSSSTSRGRSLASLPAEILQHIAFEVALTTTTSSSSSSSSSTTRPSSSSSTTSSTLQYIDPVITSLLQAAAAAAAADKAKHSTKRRRRNTNRNNLHHHNQQYIPIPHHLPALLLTCPRFNNLLNISSNPSFYARLFRFHYDSSAIARRFGAQAVTPQALAAEYRTRAQRAAQIFKPSDSISAGDHLLNLWTIYLLAIENDGRNAVTLHNLRALPYLDFLSASPSRPLFQPDRDYPDNCPEHALALHIRHLLAPLPSSALAREALSNKLRPFVFAAHRFDAFVAPWTYEHLPVGTFSRYSFDAASHHDQPHTNHQQQHQQHQQRRHHQAHQPAPQEVNNPYFTDLSLRDRHHAVPYCGGILHLSPPNAVLPACQMFFGLIMQQQLEQEEEEVRRGQAAPPLQHHHQQQQQQDGREGEEGGEDDDGSDSSHSHSSSTATASAHELALDDFPTAVRNNGQYVGAITANAIHEALITGNITLQQLFEALQAAAETVSLAAAAVAADSSSSPSAAAQDPSTTSSSSSTSPSTSTSTTSRPTTTATTTPSWGPSAIGPSAAAIAAAAVAASTALQDSSSYLNPALSAALTSICEDLTTKASQVASLNGSKRHLAVSALIADDSRREERARAAVAAAAAAAVGSSSSVVVVPASGKKAGKQRAVEDNEEEEEEEEEEGEEVDSREVAESDHAAISRALSQALNLIRSSDSQLLIRPAAQQEEEDEQQQSTATATDTDTDTDTDTGEVAPAQQEQQRRRRRRQPDSTGSAASSLSGPSSMTAQTPLVNLWPSSAHDGDVRRLISCLSPFISPGLPSPASLTLPLDTTNSNTSSRRQQSHTTTTTGSTTGSGISGLQGTWEGQFAFFDFDSYRDMLSGRVSGLFDGQYGEQAQVWKLEEKVVRVSRKKAVVDWERERRWGNEVLAVPGGWEAGRLGGMVEEGDDGDDAERREQEAAAGLGEHAAGSGAAAAAAEGEEHEEEVMEEVDEVLISGVGHSAWGHFILRGRIRAWDGLVTLVKEYRPDGRGRWRYRGYLVAGDRLVGRWRDTFSPPHMSGYEGCFLLRRREGLLVHV